MNDDGLSILLALTVVIAPLLLAWFLMARYLDPHKPPRDRLRKK